MSQPSTRARYLALGCIGAIASALPGVAHAAPASEDGPANSAPPSDGPDGGGDHRRHGHHHHEERERYDEGHHEVLVEGGQAADIKVASPKFTAPLVDTPKTVTVIGRDQLDQTASTTLVDALRTVPGITMGAGEGGNPLGDRPFLRGMDSQNSLYLDGVRDMGNSTRETFDVQSIEVTQGSDGVMNGSGNAGGSINMVSKQPQEKRFIQGDGSFGSASYYRGTVDINQPLNDFIGFRLNGMYHHQGFAGRDAVWQERWGIAPSVKIGLTGPTSLTLDYYHYQTNELPDSGVPYAYVIGNQPSANYETAPADHFTLPNGTVIDRPRDAFYGLADRDFRHTKVDTATARFEHHFGTFTIRNTARYSHTEQDYIYTQPDDSQGNVGTSGQVWRRANTRYGYYENMTDQIDLSGKFNTGTVKHSIAAALEYSWQKAAYGSFVNASGSALSTGSTISPRCNASTIARYYCTSVANPNPYDPWVSNTSDTSNTASAITRSAPGTQTLTNASEWSASLFDTITVTDWLLFNLGGRWDRFSTNVSPAIATGATSRSWVGKAQSLWTYQAGAMVKPAKNGTIYFSASRSAVPPGSFLAQGSEDNGLTPGRGQTTVNVDDLKPQITNSLEVGTKWELFHENLLLTLAAFQTKTENARITNPDGTTSFAGTKRVRGIELGYNGNITKDWSLFGGFLYMPSKTLNAGLSAVKTATGATVYLPAASEGKPFPNTPEYSFTAFTNYKLTKRFALGGGVIYMGKVYGGFSNSAVLDADGNYTKTRATYVPDYWRFDANASYAVNDHLVLKLNALNLTDKLYYSQAYATHYATQAPGRTIIGTISVKY